MDETTRAAITDHAKDFFNKRYNPEESKRTWQRQSEQFRTFWQKRIMIDGDEISEDEMIPVVQVLDRAGKRRSDEERKVDGAAFTNIYQGTWYKIFRGIKSDMSVKRIIDKIFNSNLDKQRIELLNQLKEGNTKIDALTGENATVMNDFQFAWDPTRHISVMSLADRFKIIDFFGVDSNLHELSWGEKIVTTNEQILSLIDRLDLKTDPRGLSSFLYYEPVKILWRQKLITGPTSEVRTGRKKVEVLTEVARHGHLVGTAIHFRDMDYGPTEENGVIFLFSKITKDLGIKVISIQKQFPDAEAIKYATDGRGYRVFIEFEYRSSDFMRHGHLESIKEGKPCDMIVCWEHDWKACPKSIEVLELKEIIKQLEPEEA